MPDGDDPEQTPAQRSDERSLWTIFVVICIGLVVIIVFGLQATTLRVFVAICGLGMALAGAALLGGALLGLLFGIPRRLQQEAKPAGAGPVNGDDDERPAPYAANTNLEQISDWLTKILVGVGLTQLGDVTAVLSSLGAAAAPGLGGFVGSEPLAIAIAVYFSISGFLLGYLWTRLYLGRALAAAEGTYSLKRKVTELERQAAADTTALRVVSAQLVGPDGRRPKQDELDKALEAASEDTRSHAFHRAQLQRWRNWRDPPLKPAMERTIPVFRALIASDARGKYHENHGHLGYALKDSATPDWKGAEEALARAIAIRGSARDANYHNYEANRAYCRIMLDEKNPPEKASESVKAAILQDLIVAARDKWVRNWILGDPTISNWLSFNHVNQSVITSQSEQ